MIALPIIDLSPFVRGHGDRAKVGAQIAAACADAGFFYVVGHGVDETLQARLEALSRVFFAQDVGYKMRLHMSRGGRAWRGYFPVGAELTSGRPDAKEGLYFGAELDNDHPLVRVGTPLHGPNLFPEIDGFRETVLAYLTAMTQLGHTLMAAIARSLDLEESFFHTRYTGDPLVLFRIFHYPPDDGSAAWGVGEHTDYGVLTILKQDDAGGLEVKSPRGWIAAPPVPGSFVCNIGDMLDRMTGGRYRSTPHRVVNRSGRGRLSFPFFFDPNFHAAVEPLPLCPGSLPVDDRHERWDGASVHEWSGTYGEYLIAKVSKVFPQLSGQVLRHSL